MGNRMKQCGMTLLEVLIVIGIMGVLMAITYPSIMNSLETRNLDNSARGIETSLQQARYRAVDAKISHRIRFYQNGSVWWYALENETATNVWSPVAGVPAKSITATYVVTVNLPTVSGVKAVEFSPVGIIQGFSSTQNTVTLQNTTLKTKNQPDLRILQMYQGGSIRYVRTSS